MWQKILKYLVYSYLAFSVAASYANTRSQILLLNEQQRLDGHIAKQAMSRLTMVNDRIVRVISEAELLHIEHDEHTGQVFVKPTSEQASVALTIISENGLTQDLNLIADLEQSATILLKPAKIRAEPPAALASGLTADASQELIAVMRQAVLGQLTAVKLAATPVRAKVPGCKLQFNAAYQAGALVVELWRITNTTKELKRLAETDVFQVGDLAISVLVTKLAPQASTYLYILRS